MGTSCAKQVSYPPLLYKLLCSRVWTVACRTADLMVMGVDITFWGPGVMLWGLSCLPLTAPQPASSLGSTNRLSILSAVMPSTTGAASAATAGAVMCSSGWSIFSEAEGMAAGGSSKSLPAALPYRSCHYGTFAWTCLYQSICM